MKAIDFVGIGGANMDLCHRSFSSVVMRDSNPGSFEISVGGVMRNICENAAKLGVKTALVAPVGDDIFSSIIVSSLKSVGIDDSLLLRKKGNSSMYVSILDHTGDMAIACSDMRIVDTITPEDIDRLIPAMKAAKVICVDGNLSRDTLSHISKVAKSNNIKCFFDPVSTSHAKKFIGIESGFYAAKPNLLELEAISQVKIESEEDFKKAVETLLDAGIKKLFVTLGKDGACCCTKGKIIPGCFTPANAKNATGAGDAFTAGLVYSEILGLSDEETLKTAMAAGAVAVTSWETVNPSMSTKIIKEVIERNK